MIPLDELSDDQFENMVVELSRKVFGEGIQGFSSGPDGGRDARFVGTAERFPSTASPWTGTTIIQAKHDNGLNGHFAEKKFSGTTANSVITKEIVRLKKLVAANDLDNYLLVSNRRLAAGTNTAICQRISHEVGIDIGQLHLWGIDDIHRLLHQYPDTIDLARIRWAETPLMVDSKALSDVILAIADTIHAAEHSEDPPVVPRVPYSVKNEINNMSGDFAKELEKRYLKYTSQIQRFLSRPENDEVLRRYADAVEEFQLKIISKRNDYDTFDQVFIYLTDLLIRRDPVLASTLQARLVRVVIFYMYWFCDIGQSEFSNH